VARVVVLDASVVIALLSARDAHHAAARQAMVACREDMLVLPASAYAELLVGPHRLGREASARADRFVDDFALRVEPLTRDIARRAAALRARHPGLGLGDTLVLATGEELDATAVLTADRRWTAAGPRVRIIA
jgi:predicted nucleic acid-binding protein